MRDKISLQQIQIENESTQKQLTNSQNRIIIFLLASSIIEIFWVTAIFRFEIIYELRILVIIPFVFNIFSWLFYALQYLIPIYFNRRRFFELNDREYDNVDDNRAIKNNQILKYSLYRQRKIERIIIPLIIFQFISMSVIIIMLFQIWY